MLEGMKSENQVDMIEEHQRSNKYDLLLFPGPFFFAVNSSSLNMKKSSVLALDDSTLDANRVENLIKFCPTKEEMELLRNYTGDKDNLGRCEQFFLELMKVPRVESKLRVFSFEIQFGTQGGLDNRNENWGEGGIQQPWNSFLHKRF